MLPARRPTRSMMERSVVVLPAPLRPSRVTTSPSRTSRSTPCRMWLSPYQASSPRTSSSAAPPAGPGRGRVMVIASAMLGHSHGLGLGLGAEIGGDDIGIARDGRVVALGEYAAARKHGDGVAETGHHLKVVLHQQH